MNGSQFMRESGLNALVAFNGDEGLKYINSPVGGTVNRTPIRLKDGVASRDGQLDFEVIGMTEIEVQRSVMPEPKVGEHFYCSIGLRHRVRFVVFTDLTWVCYCTPSKAGTKRNQNPVLDPNDIQIIMPGGEGLTL